MKVNFTTIALAALACMTQAAPQPSNPPDAGACTDARRLRILNKLTGAFMDENRLRAIKTINETPMADNAVMFFYFDESPPVPVSFSGDQFKAVAIAARQAVYKFTPNNSNFNNATSLMDVQAVLGANGIAPSPIQTRIQVYTLFNLPQCTISRFDSYFTVPNRIGGMPFDPPELPPVPTILGP